MSQQDRKPPVEQRGIVTDVVSNVIAGGIVAGTGAAAKATVSKVTGKSGKK